MKPLKFVGSSLPDLSKFPGRCATERPVISYGKFSWA
jgi:hypothetical protein